MIVKFIFKWLSSKFAGNKLYVNPLLSHLSLKLQQYRGRGGNMEPPPPASALVLEPSCDCQNY